ncbi:MAG: signal peptidase I [Planctomycetes bacterium]|nr:signal peptidase I [Planctomycetota bacterium]MBL7039855.1 signal peptidase I [Pirellulaceae bacterium]
MFMMALYFAVIILLIAALWKVFSKAGKPGWAAIVPIYNCIVLLEICGRPIWWIILLLIPCVNIVILLLINIDLAKSFGKDVGFGIGLWLLGIIFLPILGFGKSQYVGPAAPQ